MCITFRVSQKGRGKLGTALGVLNAFLVLFGFALIMVAIYIKVEIGKKLLLFENYNKDPVPFLLISVGCLMMVFHALGAKIGVDCGDPETSNRFKSILLGFMWSLVILSIVTLSCGILCLVHPTKIRHSLHLGLPNVMKLYKTNQYAKTSIDRLQSLYKCCGTRNFKEWFRISWINDDYLNTDSTEVLRFLRHGNFYKDDIPWSCCNARSPRPCIHHFVKDVALHRHYSEVTIYRHGCAEVLGTYMSEKILIPVGIVVFVAYGFELIVLIVFRHLQTSMQSAFDEDDPEGIGDSYLIGSMPCKFEGAKNPAKMFDKKEQKEIEDYKRAKKEKKKKKKKKQPSSESESESD